MKKSIWSLTTATLFFVCSLFSLLNATSALPTPGPHQLDVGPLIPHQSRACDPDFHSNNYRRWTKLDAAHVLQKRQLGGREWMAIQHLFKKDNNGPSTRSVDHLQFQLALRLTPRDQTLVSRKLREMHDPAHKSFRRYLGREETFKLLSPSEAALDLAYSFLSQNGIPASQVERTDDNQTLSFWVEIEKANRMLNADFAVHRLDADTDIVLNSTKKRQRRCNAALYQLGTEKYSLPQALAKYVGHINPGSDFRQVEPHVRPNTRIPDPHNLNRTMHSNAWNLAAPHSPPLVSGLKTCDVEVTPDCLRAIYHMPVPAAKDTKGVSVATLNLRPYMSVPEDLKAGFARYGGGRIPPSYLPAKIDIDVPGVSQSTDTPDPSEPDLDLEIMVPLVYPMTVYDLQGEFKRSWARMCIFYPFERRPGLTCMVCEMSSSVAQRNVLSNFGLVGRYGAVQQLGQGSYPRPDVLSVSYGATECSFECEQYYCGMTDALSLQGTTLLASSGDNGNQDIQDPGLCPYWVSVGATQTNYGSTVTSLQVVSNNDRGWTFDSSGGFSTGCPPPDWQIKAIQEYTKKHFSETWGQFQTNAGVPDVAAQVGGSPIFHLGKCFLTLFSA
ncbi:hypothetical protein QFC22_002516 [Naganishia vaughanmartiniae]|uniref:Uncharacterized protein n=1 Tax=Naganishia vaughanmartiniae TaxID=1424756 RepID=A0ACC2XCY8_9TREE|nr:hypothetical protein QFC22_002516 [Naganishia vaughanmartiniae]